MVRRIRLCIKTGIQEQVTECGEHGEWGGVLYSGECGQTFRGMSPNIPGNVAKHSGECPQTFQGMSPNIPGNVAKYSGERRKTFRGMSPNIPGNVLKYSKECLSAALLLYASSVATRKIHVALGKSNQGLCGESSLSQPLC